MSAGISNSLTVQPPVAIQRGQLYKERAGFMYAVLPWTLAQGTCELLYRLIQVSLQQCKCVLTFCYMLCTPAC